MAVEGRVVPRKSVVSGICLLFDVLRLVLINPILQSEGHVVREGKDTPNHYSTRDDQMQIVALLSCC